MILFTRIKGDWRIEQGTSKTLAGWFCGLHSDWFFDPANFLCGRMQESFGICVMAANGENIDKFPWTQRYVAHKFLTEFLCDFKSQ